MTTIIKPNQHLLKINWLLLLMIGGLLTIVVQGIFSYNQIVNLQHALNGQAKFFDQAKLVNIDFKNQLYQLVDPKNLINLANQLGLVKVNKPEFLLLESNLPQLTANIAR